jgi:hypothetical protein
MRKEQQERVRLLAMSEYEAMEEGVPVWYQRLRYLREIEAAKWLESIKKNLPSREEKPSRHKKLGYWKY